MKSGLEVFDFNEEDELPEIASRKYFDRCKNPNLNRTGILKYEFLQLAASGASAQRKEANNVPCVDIETNGSDHSCDDVVQSQPMETSNLEFGPKGGQSVLDDCPPISSEQQVDKVENSEPRTSPLELKLRDSGAEPPSPGISQSACLPSHSQSSEETFDVFSSANISLSECSPSSPTSDIAEDGSAENHCSGDMVMDDMHQAVAINPDYILYQDNYWRGMVIFSGDGVKIKGSTPDGNLESFSFEREIDDIVHITCEWVPRTGHVLVKVDVLSKVVKEADDANSPSGVEELKLMIFEPNWSEKQEVITSLNVKYSTIWEAKYEHMTELDEDALLVQKPYFPYFDEHFEEVVYPKGDVDAVSISKRDVDLLQPDTFVNDTIIDFYIKYLKNQIPVDERQRFHFFNSFFFRKLADLDKDPSSISDGRAAFLRVHKWTRKVDMFGKDYIFVPVNFNLHWSLIVVCHPGEVAAFKDEVLDKSSKIPCILHMDSLRGSHDGLKNLVQSYLWEEWKGRRKESSDDLSSKFMNLRFISLELPQQENFYDCGLFLLHYLELFLTEAPDNFNPFEITKFSNFLNADWFLPTEASLKRTLIQKLIFELLEMRSREISSTECIDNDQSAAIPETDETGVQLITEECRPELACHGDLLNLRDTQGVEFSLLASSSTTNLQNVDSGVGLRELIEQGVTSAALLGHFNSFNETYYNQNKSASFEEEDTETGEQNGYLASEENGFQLLTGTTSQACSVPFSSGDFMLDGDSWNTGNLTERDINSSPETSSTSDDDADLGIIGSNGIGEETVNDENERSDVQGHPSEEDEREIEDIAPPSSEVSEGIADAVPEKPDELHFGNQDNGVCPTKEHRRDDDTQTDLDDPLRGPIEPAAKRIRFTLRHRHPDAEAVDVSTRKLRLIGVGTAKHDDAETPGDGASTEPIEPIAEETAALKTF